MGKFLVFILLNVGVSFWLGFSYEQEGLMMVYESGVWYRECCMMKQVAHVPFLVAQWTLAFSALLAFHITRRNKDKE
ncbi:hypothetical protein IMZ31_19440 (plasmid) [Pontibacillus sp. ALD_SL1]|uniref:hypothetical protein n=1 Tax=Pontibacillus sp. ALD_SL1 TaxID=2777185 RepID=UPI001A96391C|nr:hypothetical protein [Pontibacillus sp. ALD_SL1]QST02725.1 hypothetical protein IMZ31_19440 [Pontibacillus sp. ALD_SL1]